MKPLPPDAKYRRLTICMAVGDEHRLDREIMALVKVLRRLIHQRKADRCREAQLGRPMLESTRAKLSVLRKGKPAHPNVVAATIKRQTGRKLAPAVRQNISKGKLAYEAAKRAARAGS